MRWVVPILLIVAVGCGPSGSSSDTSATDKPAQAKVKIDDWYKPKTKLGAGPAAIEKLKDATITAYRLDPKESSRNETPGVPGYLRGWKILEEKVVDAAEVRRQILRTLTASSSFSQYGAKCFDPGLGFRLVEGEIKSDFVICLDCDWVYCYLEPKGHLSSEGLTKAGRKELTDLYTAIFGAAPARIY